MSSTRQKQQEEIVVDDDDCCILGAIHYAILPIPASCAPSGDCLGKERHSIIKFLRAGAKSSSSVRSRSKYGKEGTPHTYHQAEPVPRQPSNRFVVRGVPTLQNRTLRRPSATSEERYFYINLIA